MRPERILLNQLIQQHTSSGLAQAETKGDSISEYIEKGVSRFIDCGILARGFARVLCDGCGNDFPVAPSCKVRGVSLPAIPGERSSSPPHLVEHVYPRAAV